MKRYIFSESQIQKVIDRILYEQDDPEEDDLGFIDEPGDEDDAEVDDAEVDPPVDPEDIFAVPDEDERAEFEPLSTEPIPGRPDKPKKLSRIQQIKQKWMEEASAKGQALSEIQLEEAVQFFYERKDRLKPYKPYGTIDPRTNRYWINLPEIATLAESFPDLIPVLEREDKMKDLMNYTWNQISVYMRITFDQAMVMDDENEVAGEFTPDERIQMALKRWTNPFNQIFNQNGLIVYKIESRSEAIALGALDHAIWRKYNTPKGRATVDRDILDQIDYEWAHQPWCVARPNGSDYGPNLFATYRGKSHWRAFYFVLDNNKPEWDEMHITALQAIGNGPGHDCGPYIITKMPNANEMDCLQWEDVERYYPALRGKKNLFPYFGTTQREGGELQLDDITFRKGDPQDFNTQPPAVKKAYIENGRYIRHVRAFLSLSAELRELYVAKTSELDWKVRFLCDDPNDPLGILNVLQTQDLPKGIYKYLDVAILKTRLRLKDGVLAIKETIIGNKFKRIYTDVESSYSLCTLRQGVTRVSRTEKYGVVNLNKFDTIKDFNYIQGKPKSFVELYEDEAGIRRKKIHIFDTFMKINGAVVDKEDYFYFMHSPEALTVRNSPDFRHGKYFDGVAGDNFIKEKVETRQFIKI